MSHQQLPLEIHSHLINDEALLLEIQERPLQCFLQGHAFRPHPRYLRVLELT